MAIHLLHTESESTHLVEDLVGRLDPFEGRVPIVVGLDVGQNRRAELGDARVRPALEGLRDEQPKKRSTRFSQDAYVGVKWKWTRGCRSNQAAHRNQCRYNRSFRLATLGRVVVGMRLIFVTLV